jgi:uncharacterized membrane protein
MDMRRLMTNLFGGWFQMGRHFPPAVLDRVAQTVAAGERLHRGELRVAVESRLPWSAVTAGMTARDRAVQLFSHLRVWDTEENCGVLLYVLLAEHRIEIVADRGIAQRVAADQWQAVTLHMRDLFAQGRPADALLTAVEEAGALLARHYPGNGAARANELPDSPLIL